MTLWCPYCKQDQGGIGDVELHIEQEHEELEG